MEEEDERDEEDTRKPEGTFGVDVSLQDAGTDKSRQEELKSLFKGEVEVFNPSEVSSQECAE